MAEARGKNFKKGRHVGFREKLVQNREKENGVGVWTHQQWSGS